MDAGPNVDARPTGDAGWGLDGGQTLIWSSAGPLTAPFTLSLPVDAEITRVTFDYDFQKGGQVDYALAVGRSLSVPVPYPMITGGYADVLTTHPFHFATTGHWHQELDLSQTPLYLPANTDTTCWSSGGNDPTTAGARSCAIDVRPAGAVRHRILRIPWLDAGLPPSGPFFSSLYAARPAYPLHVKGFLFYDGVVGTYTACLQHLSATGAVIQEHCLPTTTRTTTDDSQSYPVEPVDWLVQAPDILSARCDVQTQEGWDGAFYVIVEVPALVPPGPENAFRDYGLVPPSSLSAWCTTYIDGGVAWPAQKNQLCYVYDQFHQRPVSMMCSPAELIQQCIDAYPPASICATGGGC